MPKRGQRDGEARTKWRDIEQKLDINKQLNEMLRLKRLPLT